MFSSKKKNVELNLMFISQANKIGNSEIPVSLSREVFCSSIPFVQTCASFGVCRLKHVRHLVFVVSNMCIIWHLKHVHHNSIGVCCLKNVHHLSFVVSNMCIICLLNYHPWLSYGHKLGGGGMYI
jgi:hypothetical protein